MGLFDLVFDELGKEIKEAPGWLSLVFLCNLVLFVPVIKEELELLRVSKEETTIATLVAMVFFFSGDILDSLFFPRDRDGKRAEKLLKTSMLILGALAIFLLLESAWLWSAALTLLWVIIIPIYDTRRRSPWSVPNDTIRTTTPRNKASGPAESDEDMTGFKWLVLQYDGLARSQDGIRKKLAIHRGIYDVSRALARTAEMYTKWIWLPNELGKFVRSAVFPALVSGLWLMKDGQTLLAVLIISVAPLLLILSFWLKSLHMRKLYDLASDIVEKQQPMYSSPAPCHGVRLFLWGDDVVACIRMSPTSSILSPSAPARV